MTRNRTRLNGTPRFGGKPCQAPATETRPCPINCRFGEWSEWSTCSNTCGEGVQTRNRKEETIAAHGGKECRDEEKLQTKKCNVWSKACCRKDIVPPSPPPPGDPCRYLNDSWH